MKICQSGVLYSDRKEFLLFVEGLLEQPNDDREVLALVVGRQDDRVLVLGDSHFRIFVGLGKQNASRCRQDNAIEGDRR